MSAIEEWQLLTSPRVPAASARHEAGIELWPYRDRTMALLKRYARLSVEAGRLPSLVGREIFRSRITSYSLMSFEDVVIFVHDVERALEMLGPVEQKLIGSYVLEEYSMMELARLMGCCARTVERMIPDALDELSRIFLEGGLIRELEVGTRGERACQEGKTCHFEASHWQQSKNNS